MCGIIGIVSKSEVVEKIIISLKRLEYRGYDSAGIATIDNNKIYLTKTPGKVSALSDLLQENSMLGKIGIGHTRWATHGAPSSQNAHPFVTKDIALIHNGVIENYMEVKKTLLEDGYKFLGDTDSEVLAQLIQSYVDQGLKLKEAIKKAAEKCEGLYSFVIISTTQPETIFGLKKGLPLAIGIGENEMYLSSDVHALNTLTDRFIYLNDNEIINISASNYEISDLDDRVIKRKVKKISKPEEIGDKDEFEHYMLKEIYEQPSVLKRCFKHYYNSKSNKFFFDSLDFTWSKISKIYIIACGTSYYAAYVAKYWLEQYAYISVEIEISSEFRYKEMQLDSEAAFIFISQSGETADTLAALKMVKEKGLASFCIVNREESSIGNLADFVLPMCAGNEVGVASTKTFTCALMVLALLSIYIGKERGKLSVEEINEYLGQLYMAPDYVTKALDLSLEIKNLCEYLKNTQNIIYIARGSTYPIALEAALKVKELSYLPALGVAAGELKHGPIALIDSETAICVIAPSDKLFPKLVSNIQEAYARGGKIILLSDEPGINKLKESCFFTLKLPPTQNFLTPIIYTIPVQMLAYHLTCLQGHDVDQPRNLAKSVTVE